MLKVELGCGYNKTPGFLGIDRFALPGVDVVHDLNENIPLDDNSVDVLYSSHALEHLQDLNHIMGEIYRVCKDEALVLLLLPYNTSSNDEANVWHVQNFNENTFRFFTNHHQFYINPWEVAYPLVGSWGLMGSDNSRNDLDFRCIGIEFFYFEEYRKYNDSIKTILRHSLRNVCDQSFYSLVVCKKNQELAGEKICALRELTTKITSMTSAYQLRKRNESTVGQTKSLVDFLVQIIENSQAHTKEELEQALLQINEDFQKILSLMGRQSGITNEAWSTLERRMDAAEKALKETQKAIESLHSKDAK